MPKLTSVFLKQMEKKDLPQLAVGTQASLCDDGRQLPVDKEQKQQKEYETQLTEALTPMPKVLVNLIREYVPKLMLHLIRTTSSEPEKELDLPMWYWAPVTIDRGAFVRATPHGAIRVQIPFRIDPLQGAREWLVGPVQHLALGDGYVVTVGSMSLICLHNRTFGYGISESYYINWDQKNVSHEAVPLDCEQNRQWMMSVWWDNNLKCLILERSNQTDHNARDYCWLNGQGEIIQTVTFPREFNSTHRMIHVGCGGLFSRDNNNILWFTGANRLTTPCLDLAHDSSNLKSLFLRLWAMAPRVGDPSLTVRTYKRIPATLRFIQPSAKIGEMYIHSLLHFIRDWRTLPVEETKRRYNLYASFSVAVHDNQSLIKACRGNAVSTSQGNDTTGRPEDILNTSSFPHTDLSWIEKDSAHEESCESCQCVCAFQKLFTPSPSSNGCLSSWGVSPPHTKPPATLVEAEAKNTLQSSDCLFSSASFENCSLTLDLYRFVLQVWSSTTHQVILDIYPPPTCGSSSS